MCVLQFLVNGFTMVMASAVIRILLLWFNVYISNCLGENGMGIFTLLMTVLSFAQGVATSGLSLAATRIVSEELAINCELGAKRAVKKCLTFALLLSVLLSSVVWIFAPLIGTVVLKGEAPFELVRALALCFPGLTFSSVFSGYFIAVRKAYKSSFVQIAEVAVRVLCSMLLMKLLLPKGVAYGCLALILASVVSEGISFAVNLALYLNDKKRLINFKSGEHLTSRVFKIALPVVLSSMLKSALSSVKQIVIPTGLVLYGFSKKRAISDFGLMNGMVIPIILFPYAIIGAVASLTVPEIASRHIRGNRQRINDIIVLLIKNVFIFSLFVCGVLFCYGEELGITLYRSIKAGRYITLLAPLVLLMYMDTVTDSILKGIDKQVTVVKINIFDTLLCIALIYLLVPKAGLTGYIAVLYISELLNLILSMGTLYREYKFKIDIYKIFIKPSFAMIVGLEFVKYTSPTPIRGFLLMFFIYLSLLIIFGCFRVKPFKIREVVVK